MQFVYSTLSTKYEENINIIILLAADCREMQIKDNVGSDEVILWPF